MSEIVSCPSRCGLVSAAILLGLASPWAPTDARADDSMTRIYGGEPAKTCEWPTTVGLSICTGTLIHPRVVLYAAHCGTGISTVQLGEQYKTNISHKIKTVYCKRNPEFQGQASLGRGVDSAYCLLEKEVEDVAIAPIFYGCETEELKDGGTIWLVGFGKNNNTQGLAKAGIKFKVETDFVKYQADERELVVGSNGKTACNGDSGGPAYLKMSDGSWRTIGITSYGADTTCTKVAYYSNASKAVPWIQKSLNEQGYSDIDITPCFSDDGEWEPSEHCGGFATEPGQAFGSWDNFCSEGAPKSEASALCGEPNPKAGGGTKDNEAPVLKFRKPKDEQVFETGKEVVVEIKVSDNEDENPDVVLTINGEDQPKLKEGPYKWTLEDLEAGSYSMKAKATDEAGNEASAEDIEIVIEDPEKDEDSNDKEDSDSTSGSKSSEDKDSDESSSASDEEDSGDDENEDSDSPKSNDPNDKKKGRGCTTNTENSPREWTLLAFLGLWGLRRRRSR